MDNSENMESSEAEPPSGLNQSLKNCFTTSVESDVDNPIVKNGIKENLKNGQNFEMDAKNESHNFKSNENGINEVQNGVHDAEGYENGVNGIEHAVNGLHDAKCIENGVHDQQPASLPVLESEVEKEEFGEPEAAESLTKDEESQTIDSDILLTVGEDPEIPFSQYSGDENDMDEVAEIDGSGDHQSGRRSLSSPVKATKGGDSNLRRISCRDFYPDRETEEFEDSDGGSSDEEEEDVIMGPEIRGSPKSRRKRLNSHSLLWTDDQSHASTMHHLDVFRRSKLFCDLILQVGGREIHCHRVVIGGASRFLYKELMQGEKENNSNPVVRITLNQIQPPLAPDAVESLVDYMYTAKLMIPQGQLMSVYSASVRLKVERVMPVCRRHITNQLDVESCVETWRLASSVGDLDLLTILNEFIEENFEPVTKSNEFLALPRIKMVVIASSHPSDIPPFHVIPRDGAMSNLAMSWVKEMVRKNGGRHMEELTEQIQRLTLEELTNTLPVSRVSSSSSTSNASSPGTNKQTPPIFVTANEGNSNKSSPPQRLSRTSSANSISSSSSEEGAGQGRCKLDGQWRVIASMQAADHMIALCSFGDILSSLTLHIPTNLISNGNLYPPNGSHSNCVSTSSSSSHSCASSVGSVSDLNHLSQARCAGGVTVLNGKIYALGGYNQSECLDSVECFDPTSNKWTTVAKMAHRRARFTASVLSGQIYVVGGSTGSKDVLTVERYDPVQDKWFEAPPLPVSCFGVGVATMNGKLYCIGGVQQSTGVAGIKRCHQFDPAAESWQYIAPLQTGRSFAGVAELNGLLYCVGGTDGWMCLTSVERFNGEMWIRGPNLNVPRRGAGLAKHNDTLYCAGGSDGGSFWSSVETYSPENEAWTMVPASMTVPRSNVGLVSLNGLLFAVGGFSGRQFLSTIETLDESGEEWTTHDVHMVAAGCGNPTSSEESQTTTQS